MIEKRPIRVLLAKPGLDGHNRGINLVGKALRDAGMEVLYGGMRVTPEQVVEMALQEDVDVIGLSIFSGGLMTVVPKIFRALRESEARDIPVIVGGIVPPMDERELLDMGIARVFGPGSDLDDIVDCVQELARSRLERETA